MANLYRTPPTAPQERPAMPFAGPPEAQQCGGGVPGWRRRNREQERFKKGKGVRWQQLKNHPHTGDSTSGRLPNSPKHSTWWATDTARSLCGTTLRCYTRQSKTATKMARRRYLSAWRTWLNAPYAH